MPLKARPFDTGRVERPTPDLAGDPVLTPAQMRFARLHRARPGCSGAPPGSVFFYHDDVHGTDRWLVGIYGEVLEATYFTRDAPRTARDGVPESDGGGANTSRESPKP